MTERHCSEWQNSLRAKSNFASRFNLICAVQSACEKYSALRRPQINCILPLSRLR
jgi:hypothetical protein